MADGALRELEGKVVVVTGAGSGIGEAVAHLCARNGARMVLTDIDRQKVEAVTEAIVTAGGEASAFVQDTSVPEEHEACVRFALETYGGLHGAVNNAGTSAEQHKVGDYPVETWRRVMSVNLDGVFYAMRTQVPAMLSSGGGSIVNMASVLATVGYPGHSAYVTAKHALLGLTRTAAIDHSADGVRTNAVGPGFIRTPLVEAGMSDEDLSTVEAMHAVGRLGLMDEVAELVSFLLSDRASFITGAFYAVDGGYAVS